MNGTCVGWVLPGKKLGALALFLSLLPLSGCGKKEEEEETIADLCRADCSARAAECPEGSTAAEFEDFCRILCSFLEDSEDCREKWREQDDCLSQYEVDCDTGNWDDEGACDEHSAPFTIDISEENDSGQCVQEDVTTE